MIKFREYSIEKVAPKRWVLYNDDTGELIREWLNPDDMTMDISYSDFGDFVTQAEWEMIWDYAYPLKAREVV